MRSICRCALLSRTHFHPPCVPYPPPPPKKSNHGADGTSLPHSGSTLLILHGVLETRAAPLTPSTTFPPRPPFPTKTSNQVDGTSLAQTPDRTLLIPMCRDIFMSQDFFPVPIISPCTSVAHTPPPPPLHPLPLPPQPPKKHPTRLMELPSPRPHTITWSAPTRGYATD